MSEEDSKNEKEKNSKLECKVVLLGEMLTGKTSLISRLVDNTFNYNETSTFVASNFSKEIEYSEFNGITLRLQIWDTAGQEKFRSVNKIFYKEAAVVILVYDITNERSFEQLKTYWYQEVKQKGEKNVVFAVAGNKCDLFSDEKITEKEGREFANEIGAVFFQTSPLSNINVSELFKEVGKVYLQKNGLDKDNEFIKLNGKKKKKKEGCC